MVSPFVAHAASTTHQFSTEELARVLMSADSAPKDRRKARKMLHHRIIRNPEMLVTAPTRLIIRYPMLFDSQWLDMLIHHLESGTSERAASKVLATFAIHTNRPEMIQGIVSSSSADFSRSPDLYIFRLPMADHLTISIQAGFIHFITV